MRWRRAIARTWLVLLVAWIASIVRVFSYGEPAPVQETADGDRAARIWAACHLCVRLDC